MNRGQSILYQGKIMLFEPALVEVVIDMQQKTIIVDSDRLNYRDPALKNIGMQYRP